VRCQQLTNAKAWHPLSAEAATTGERGLRPKLPSPFLAYHFAGEDGAMKACNRINQVVGLQVPGCQPHSTLFAVHCDPPPLATPPTSSQHTATPNPKPKMHMNLVHDHNVASQLKPNRVPCGL
jgi:hypothetical protein